MVTTGSAGAAGAGVNVGAGAGVTCGTLEGEGSGEGKGGGGASGATLGGGPADAELAGVSAIPVACARTTRGSPPDATRTHAEHRSQRPTAHIDCIGPQWRTPCQAVTV